MLLHALLDIVQLAHLRLEGGLDGHQRSAVGSRAVLSESRVRVPDHEGNVGDLVAGEQVPPPRFAMLCARWRTCRARSTRTDLSGIFPVMIRAVPRAA